jgi:hypothetical protein
MPTLGQIRHYVRSQGGSIPLAKGQVTLVVLSGETTPRIAGWEVPNVAKPSDDFWDGYPSLEDVPQRVSPRQFRLALIAAGVDLANVALAIDAIPDATAKANALVEWEYANSIERDNPTIAQLAPALGFDTEEKVDNLFINASKL